MKKVFTTLLKFTPKTLLRQRALLFRTALTLLLTAFVALYIAPLFFSLPEKLGKDPQPGQYFTDRHGAPLRRLLRADLAIDAPATLQEIPSHLIEATLAVEDARFRKHGGIDSIGIMRALYDSLRARRLVSGASTISQQLIKITSPAKPRTVRNKIIESLGARKLEMSWGKNQILVAYLNRLPYGNLLTGCRAAARGYFNKPLSDLSLAECALLAGLPNRPSQLNPHRHLDKAVKRQRWVLKRMLSTGKITPEEYQHALGQTLQIQNSHSSSFQAPHLVDLIINKTQPSTLAPSPSTAIKTTLDLPLQKFVEQSINKQLQKLEQNNHHSSALQAAAVIIDNASGEVRGLVGSRSYFNSTSGQINGAWTARSPGSALKPFTYLLALERGHSAASRLDDLPLEYMTPTGAYRPVNYDRRFRGPVTLRESLATSLNVPAIRLLDELGGPAPLHATLIDLGLTSLDKDPGFYGLGLTIGSAEVRLLELTNAYACLARLGRYADYRLITSAKEPPLNTRELFSPDACYILADILSDQQARTSAFGLNSPLNLPFKVACKTGTSTDYRDNWTVGFTPRYTVGVWVGCFDNQALPQISGVIGAGPIFHDIFTHLYSKPNDKAEWYTRPNHIVTARIDPLNGKRLPPTENQLAPHRPNHTRLEIFRQNNLPPLALESDYDQQGRTLLPAHYQTWFAKNNHQLQNRANLVQQPTLHSSNNQPFQILSPLTNTVVYLDQDLPHGGTIFSLKASIPAAKLRWASPSLKISTTATGSPTAILKPGIHQIIATDILSGYSISVAVQVDAL
ncbi:MAG: penicillin-binding protein 1C [Verrucomicrobiota bacterium]